MITIIENSELTTEMHVHATGCSDITRSEDHFSKNYVTAMTSEECDSVEQAAIYFFGEVAADNHEWGSEEWLNEVMFEWKVAARVFPCVK